MRRVGNGPSGNRACGAQLPPRWCPPGASQTSSPAKPHSAGHSARHDGAAPVAVGSAAPGRLPSRSGSPVSARRRRRSASAGGICRTSHQSSGSSPSGAAGAPSTVFVGVPGASRPSAPSSRWRANSFAGSPSPRPVTYSASMSPGSPSSGISRPSPAATASSQSSHQRRSAVSGSGKSVRRRACRSSAWRRGPADRRPGRARRAAHRGSPRGARMQAPCAGPRPGAA